MATVAENLTTAIAGYAAALAADSVSPQASYSLDGKSVSRNEWREGLQKLIDNLQKTINQQTPYIVSTRQVL
jgi:soluble cytochrome b562